MTTRFNLFFLIFISFILTGCDDIIEVPDISQDVVTLIAPTNGSSIQGNTTSFNWEIIANADAYELQIATPNFSAASQIVIDSTLNSNQFNTTLLSNSYEWRVRGINSGFVTAYTSSNFTVLESDGLAGNTVVLNTPENDFSTNDEVVRLTWDALIDATEYRLLILDGTTVILDETIADTEIDISFSEGRFSWQVRAQNATENTLFSSRSITVDFTDPNTPQPSSPANNEELDAGEIEFSWDRENIPGSQEGDSIFIFSDQNLQNIVASAASRSKMAMLTLQEGSFFWAVRSFDDAGNESNLSTARTLNIN